ncbi:carbohydrate ABC transporter permease [Bacillus taeanensis]|uniref:Carbohydrate ABC transporter permease n=1 Tax=Bacillus taeanensis TaxID=273032 RepID=A0A366XNR9_9BACI|nr:carbohydrate ABC transporter permease [Bacillus taeanensis]RBW67376.1 carbohydrate ABC transporter permease [Bacillus taeanensis]
MKKELPRQVILFIYAAMIIVPFSLVFFTTFKTTPELYSDPLGLPETWSLMNYKDLFLKESMMQYFMNSVIVTLVSVVCILFFASMIAYAIIRMPGKVGFVVFAFFVVGMMVPTQVNMIPIYLLVNKLGLLDTLQGVILVSIGFLIPIAVFILTGFMKTLPNGLIEAAKIDGANEWQTYSKIVMPLSLPSVATVTIFAFVIVWNDLLYPLLLLKSSDVKTLPIALLDFQGQYLTNYPMIFAGVIVASIPMIAAYVFLQRYFIAGMTAGSVKG